MVGLVVGTSLLAACTGGGGETEEAGPWPSSSASESAAATSSSAATSAPAVPVMPEEARGEGDAAAVAFVEHWVELLNYGLMTGESGPVEALVDPRCITCAALIDSIQEEGGPETEGQWTPSDLRAAPVSDDQADVVVTASITIAGESSEPHGTATFGLGRGPEGWSVAWLTAEAAG
ncbi:DUF6318 family protein [Nocardioides zeae]|uniref:DUF6318 domain-containing protein n=1 Tax=Nocardioides zeae TaxID=1457234 RepID=A0AAJ1WZX1_9ACTN|nr:DUF6318 family protein [Nocardioides zeae]MDQ1103146.1 hypothetical protein [Nocardioides zeae]